MAMKIRIRAFGDLMPLLGNEFIIELEDGASLRNLVFILAEKTDSPRKTFIANYDTMGQDLVILLNGRNIHVLKKLETPLKDGDVVTLLPPLVGG
jgi:molybdopterin synthase sulfur carrier subunit